MIDLGYNEDAGALDLNAIHPGKMSLLSSLRMREMSPLYPASKLRSVCAHYAVEKLTCESVLAGHRGCVNTVLFSWDGNTIYTGSDDTFINIYDTYPLEPAPISASSASSMERFPAERCRIKTKHTNNIFFVKDLPSSGGSKLVTCAADGKVMLMTLDEGRYESVQIARHNGRAHRLAIHPYLPNQIYSCGEDGRLNFIDIRHSHISDVAESGHYFNFRALKDQGCVNASVYDRGVMTTSFRAPNANARSTVSSIYCISVNPFKEYEIACSGESSAVAMYDTRFFEKPFGYLMPNHLRGENKHISGVKHDCTGREIIASYNDEDIYSFNIAEHLVAADEPRDHQSHARIGKRKFQESTVESGDTSAVGIIGDKEHATDTCAAAEEERNEEDHDEDKEQNLDSDEEDSRGYQRRFIGHRNYLTVKQVAYYGQSSEFVVSGSDCGNIFIWDSRTGNIVRTLFADKRGATNCLAAHPFDTLLASSGLEHTAKLWSSVGKKVSMSERQVAQSVSQLVETNVSNASTLRERSNNPIESILASLFDSPSFGARFPGFSHQGGSDSESDDDMLLPRSIAHPEEFQMFVAMMRNIIQNTGDSSDESESEGDANASGSERVGFSDAVGTSESDGNYDDDVADEESAYTSTDSSIDSNHSDDVDIAAEEEDVHFDGTCALSFPRMSDMADSDMDSIHDDTC